MKHFMLSSVKHEKSFITSGPGFASGPSLSANRGIRFCRMYKQRTKALI